MKTGKNKGKKQRQERKRIQTDRRARSEAEKGYYHSPIGAIEIVGNRQGIQAITFARKRVPAGHVPASLKACVLQLEEYFKGRRRRFSLKFKLDGTAFERQVWQAVARIPFGQTASYLDIAKAIGRPGAARAVGRANRVNPLALVIPCHRVIGNDGRLVGYGGGLWRKKWLLAHEQKPRPETSE